MSLADITFSAVQSAIDEFDDLGRDAFLVKYGFADAKRYWLVQDGKRYPSKAIAGVAHKFIDGAAILGSNSFTGGESSVVKRLESLGFQIENFARNPPWNRDELILALALYKTNPASPPSKGSAQVIELSDLLNKLHRIAGTAQSPTLRNANGVYMKMMNLRALDPDFTAQGKVGMSSGGKLERNIWAEYENEPSKLAEDAETIRQAVRKADEAKIAKLPQADEYIGEEGGVIMRLHKRYERDRKLVREKIAQAKTLGKLKCEICKFDFEKSYGALGSGYIEVHHLKPVNELGRGGKTKLTDLALLCANCHRMAHRKRKPLSISEIADFLKGAN